jgi:hypothetical protein
VDGSDQQRSEERKHHKEIVRQGAIENWRQAIDLLKLRPGQFQVFPLESFLVGMSAIADVVFDPTTNKENLASRLTEANKLTEIAQEVARQRSESCSNRKNSGG